MSMWDQISEALQTAGLEVSEVDRLESMWLSKVHPYAKHDFNPKDPGNPKRDKNAEFINDHGDQNVTRKDAQGRWHNALWRTRTDGESNWRETATAILAHLWETEFKIGPERDENGNVVEGAGPVIRKLKKRDVEGLAPRRGYAISHSVSDPRDAEKKGKTALCLLKDVSMYFEHDVAAAVFKKLTEVGQHIRDAKEEERIARNHGGGGFRRKPKAGFRREDIGAVLYDHFGQVVKAFEAEGRKPQLWTLHNEVRGFYKKLMEGNRLHIALRSDDETELGRVVPTTSFQLMSILKAKTRNSEISQLIRLGKLIVHAADIPANTDFENIDFNGRMDFFATSDGQAEIKRREAFVRVWRNCVGLAQRSLKSWADPDEERVVKRRSASVAVDDNDLSTMDVSVRSVSKIDEQHYAQHASLIFGNRSNLLEGRDSRASIFLPERRSGKQEMLWAFLRLSAAIRNGTNHFTTRPRLARLIRAGALKGIERGEKKWVAPENPTSAAKSALKAFEQLLDFDTALQKQIIIEELNKLDLTSYLEATQIKSICREMSSLREADGVIAPKFMSVLRRAEGLCGNENVKVHANLEPYNLLDLNALSEQTTGTNFVRVGILRHLYATGFREWLAGDGGTGKAFLDAVNAVLADSHKRSIAFQDSRRQHYTFTENLLDVLSDDERSDIASLSAALSAQSMADGKAVRNYRPDRSEQHRRHNAVEEIRQEIFAHLLTSYVRERGLGWIWHLEKREEGSGQAITSDMVNLPETVQGVWQNQFYAWLYLVPPDDVSLLRHQFRKSAALETKSAIETDEDFVDVLSEMDRLMGLFTRVQSAGFDGKEHVGLEQMKDVLYSDEQIALKDSEKLLPLFDAVFSEDTETHHASVPGTRRGLRQMMRYGHFSVLKGVLANHKVSKSEVEQFFNQANDGKTSEPEKVENAFQRRADLHKTIVDEYRKSDRDQQKVRQLAAEYQEVAIEAQKCNFCINAARLTDQSRLHQLMMRIVGRLTDYTLIWERDRIYVFLGMLHRQMKQAGLEFELTSTAAMEIPAFPKDKVAPAARVGILLPDSLASVIREKNHGFKDPEKPTRREWMPQQLIENGIIPIWDQDSGLELDAFPLYRHLLNEHYSKIFDDYFVGNSQEHAKDDQARKKAVKNKAKTRDAFWRLSRQQIRNDFAHYNVIGKSLHMNGDGFEQIDRIPKDKEARKGKQLNMNKLVDAVRSLLAYDRKLKNAVSQSIAKIVEEEGLFIRWQLKDDRLKEAMVAPELVRQLDFIKGELGDEFRFALPKASVRYTSMVQALFDFGSSGHRTKITRNGKEEKGPLGYPDSTHWDPDCTVPDDMKYTLQYVT